MQRCGSWMLLTWFHRWYVQMKEITLNDYFEWLSVLEENIFGFVVIRLVDYPIIEFVWWRFLCILKSTIMSVLKRRNYILDYERLRLRHICDWASIVFRRINHFEFGYRRRTRSKYRFNWLRNHLNRLYNRLWYDHVCQWLNDEINHEKHQFKQTWISSVRTVSGSGHGR